MAALVLPNLLGVGGLAAHISCRQVPAGSAKLWTPLLYLDSPYEGQVDGKATVLASPQGGVTMSSQTSNGTSGAMFTLDDWQLVSNSNATALGPGLDQPCTTSYAAVDLNRTAGRAFTPLAFKTSILSPVNSTTDRFLPTQVNLSTDSLPSGQPYSPPQWFESVFFYSRFTAPNAPPVSSCPSAGVAGPLGPITSSTEVVGVRINGGPNPVNLTTTVADPVSYQYSFETDATGTWEVDNLASTYGAGLAFDWTGCA